ncbi:MAG: response regulator transcription factor, partial [Oscillospiraceae bacterium]
GIEDKKKGFRIGADDYMVKPVNNDELVLRINALLRRSRIANEHQLTIGETTFNYEELSVRREGAAETLPQKEFLIIYKLLAYPNKIFTRLQIMDEIWGLDTNTDEHSVDVHINRLRNRFKDNPDFKIVTIRGLGYKVVINNEN